MDKTLEIQNRAIPKELYPTHEFIVSVTKDKRNPKSMFIMCAFYNGLWADKKFKQELVKEFRSSVNLNSENHLSFSEEIVKFIFDMQGQYNLKSCRFSTGKYLDGDMKPQYDNCLDADFEKVITDKDKETMRKIVFVLLQYNKKFRQLQKEIQWKLNTDPIQVVDSIPQPAPSDSKNNTLIELSKTKVPGLPDVEM